MAVNNNSSRNVLKEKLLAIIKPKSTVTAHPDTGATGHFLNEECPGVEIPHEPINVICANESEMTSTKTMELNIDGIAQEAKKAHIFPDMKKNLLSVPVLCDAGCNCNFEKDKVVITKENKTIMEGPRDPTTNLWNVTIGPPTNTNKIKENAIIQTANSAYQQRTAAELQAYLHATLCAPTVATLIKAINNNFLPTFPGLTAKAIRRYLPKSIQTAMGHLHRY